MAAICGRQDCVHNWCGGKCSLKRIAISKDLTCQHYYQTNQKETVKQEEKSIEIMNKLKIRKDDNIDWTARPTTPDTREHSYHEDRKENVFETPIIMGENKI